MVEGSKVVDYDKGMEIGRELINKGGVDKNFGFLIVCGLNMGLRINDLLKVTYDDLKGDSFIIHEQKTSKKRRIVVNSVVKESLEKMKDTLSYELGGKVFKSRLGSTYSVQYVNQRMKKLFGEGYSSHGLRKGYGRRLYEKTGKNSALVQMQLQHTSLAHTYRYIGVTQEKLDSCFEALI